MAQNIDMPDVFRFDVGDKLMCYYGPMLYLAKCLARKKPTNREIQYKVHYVGWKKSYDNWVSDSLVIEANTANLTKMAELKLQHSKTIKKKKTECKSSARKQRERKTTDRKCNACNCLVTKQVEGKKRGPKPNTAMCLYEKKGEKKTGQKRNMCQSSVIKQEGEKKLDQTPKSSVSKSKKPVIKVDYDLLSINDTKLKKLAEKKRALKRKKTFHNVIKKEYIDEPNSVRKRKQPKHRQTSNSSMNLKRRRQEVDLSSFRVKSKKQDDQPISSVIYIIDSSDESEENVPVPVPKRKSTINIFGPNKEIVSIIDDEMAIVNKPIEIIDLEDDTPELIDLTSDSDFEPSVAKNPAYNLVFNINVENKNNQKSEMVNINKTNKKKYTFNV